MTRLRHPIMRLPERYEHFYEGFVISHDGWVECPDNDTWLKALYFRGYCMSPDGRRLNDFFEVLAEKKRQGESFEGPDIGGQPQIEDGVRAGKRTSRKSVSA